MAQRLVASSEEVEMIAALGGRAPLAPLEERRGARAELAAAGGLLTYLDATQKGSGVLIDAPRRIQRPAAVTA